MSNILSELSNEGIRTNLSYYGIGDYATNIDISMIFEKSSLICNYYKCLPFNSLSSIDEYINYLFIRKLSRYSEITPHIVTDRQAEFMSSVDTFTTIFSKYTNKAVIEFINNSIESICTTENNSELVSSTISICAKFSSGIKDETFSCLIANKSHLIIDSFNEIQTTFKKRKVLLAFMLSEEIFYKNIDYRLVDILKIVKSIIGIDDLAGICEEFHNNVLKYGRDVVNGTDINKAIESQSIIKVIKDFFKDIKSPHAYEFEAELRKIDDLVNSWLLENGHSFSYEAPIDQFAKTMNSEIEWEAKMMSLTHSTNHEHKKLEHFFESTIRNSVPGLTDIIASTNISTNEYWTASRLRDLSICNVFAMEQFKLYIFDAGKINDYFSYFKTFVKYICDILNIDIIEKGFDDDMKILFQFTLDVFHNVEEEDIVLLQSVCYGLSMFASGFSEKLLREIYIKENMSFQYISDEQVTLGKLLDKSNLVLTNILGENHIQCLRYFLHNDGKERIGKNIRNNLAHWNSMNSKDLNKGLSLQLLWLLTGIVNSAFYHYYEMNKSR